MLLYVASTLANGGGRHMLVETDGKEIYGSHGGGKGAYGKERYEANGDGPKPGGRWAPASKGKNRKKYVSNFLHVSNTPRMGYYYSLQL